MEEKVTGRTLGSRSFKQLFADNSSVAILVIMWIVCLLFVHAFSNSFYQIFREASAFGLIAVGLALVMVTGNIDLSVGFQSGLCAVVTVMVGNATGSLALAIVAALVAGGVCGFLNGFVVTRIGVSPLIATIAMNYIYKGLTYAKTKDGSLKAAKEFSAVLKSFYSTQLGPKFITVSVLVVAVLLVLFYLMMHKTNLGNSLYIAGDNAEAGRFAGIRITGVAHIAYVLCGVCCGLAGVIMASKSGAAIYMQGDGKDVFAISVCVIGGIKMSGGKGTMVNVLIGLLIMRTITTVLSVLAVSSNLMDLISGLLLIAVLLIDRVTRCKEID